MSMDGGEAKRDNSHLPLPFHRWLQNTPTCYPRPPWVFKMEEFQKKKEKNEQWFSDPVYSHFGAYKMCLCVYANGRNNMNGTHVFVFICLMRGDNDIIRSGPSKAPSKLCMVLYICSMYIVFCMYVCT